MFFADSSFCVPGEFCVMGRVCWVAQYPLLIASSAKRCLIRSKGILAAGEDIFKSLFKKRAGKTHAVQESSQKCGPSVRFRVREGVFLAMTRQCAGEFCPLFEQPL